MRWCDYYEKINYWSVSTAVNKISSLEDMGEPNEIVDALIIIANGGVLRGFDRRG